MLCVDGVHAQTNFVMFATQAITSYNDTIMS